jgi:hypothetical protein
MKLAKTPGLFALFALFAFFVSLCIPMKKADIVNVPRHQRFEMSIIDWSYRRNDDGSILRPRPDNNQSACGAKLASLPSSFPQHRNLKFCSKVSEP